MLAADASPRWIVSEHSSTDTSTPTCVRPAAQVVVQAGHPGRAGHAAQPHERDAFDVRAKAEAGGDARVEGRHGDAGDGRRHDHVDVAGLEPGVGSAPATASAPRSTATSMNALLAAVKPSSAG